MVPILTFNFVDAHIDRLPKYQKTSMNRPQTHGEDLQPNEVLRKRIGANLPPVIRSTQPPPTRTRGSRPYRGRGSSRGSFRYENPASTASYRGGRGGRGGKPPNHRPWLPPKPPPPYDQRNANNPTEPPKPSDSSRVANHYRTYEQTAGSSNTPAPQPLALSKKNRKRNRAPHMKHVTLKEKRRKSTPLTPPIDQPPDVQNYQEYSEQAIDALSSSAALQIPSLLQRTSNEAQTQRHPFLSSIPPPSPDSDALCRGSLRFSPLPLDCDPSHPLAAVNRSIWIAMKRTELIRKEFSVVKASIIEDSLVVEWTYQVALSDELVEWLQQRGELYISHVPAQQGASRSPSPMQISDAEDPQPLPSMSAISSLHESQEAGPSTQRIQDRLSPSNRGPSHSATPSEAVRPLPGPSQPQPMQVSIKQEKSDSQQIPKYSPLPSTSSIPPLPIKVEPTSSISRVKRERSASPDFISSPLKPCRQGTYRIPDLPPDCRHSQLGYKENRRKWVAQERRKLVAKRLTIQRAIVRDDGLVFDWTSEIPLMPDTLLPYVDQESDAPSEYSEQQNFEANPIPSTPAPVPPELPAKCEPENVLGSQSSSHRPAPVHSLKRLRALREASQSRRTELEGSSFFTQTPTQQTDLSTTSPNHGIPDNHNTSLTSVLVSALSPSPPRTRQSTRKPEDAASPFRNSPSNVHSPTYVETPRIRETSSEKSLGSESTPGNGMINDQHVHVRHLGNGNHEKSPRNTQGVSKVESVSINDRSLSEGDPNLLGTLSFVDVFVERVGKFLTQYFKSLGQGRLILDAVYTENAGLSIEVSSELLRCVPHIPSGICYGLRTITPVMNAFPSVLKRAFREQSIDEKVTVLKTKDNKVALEVSCSVVACNIQDLLDPQVVIKGEMDPKAKVWMGHEFVLDPSSDVLKIIYHKILLRFV